MIHCDSVLEELKKLPQNWHGSGPLDDHVFNAMAVHFQPLGVTQNSAESGAGKSMLFFSQISQYHWVFALDVGKSLPRVKESFLFRSDTTAFIEGPTQQTLPAYIFQDGLDVVLIDGPHEFHSRIWDTIIFILLFQKTGC